MSQKSETPQKDDIPDTDVLVATPVKDRRDNRDNDEIDAGLITPEQIEDFALKDDYALNPQYISLVIDAADRGDGLRLRELLDALHYADIADLLGFLSEDYREEVIPWIPADDLAEVLAELDDDIREEIVETLPAPEVTLPELPLMQK